MLATQFIQHVKNMRLITLSSVASMSLPYFPTLYHKRHHFPGKKLLNVKCVLWLYLQIFS